MKNVKKDSVDNETIRSIDVKTTKYQSQVEHYVRDPRLKHFVLSPIYRTIAQHFRNEHVCIQCTYDKIVVGFKYIIFED